VIEFAFGLFVSHAGQLLKAGICLLYAPVRLDALLLDLLGLAEHLFLLLSDGLVLFVENGRFFVHVFFADGQTVFDILQLLTSGFGALLKFFFCFHDLRTGGDVGFLHLTLNFDIDFAQFQLGLFFKGICLPFAD